MTVSKLAAARAHSQLGHTDAAHQELETDATLFEDVAAEDADAPFFGFPHRQVRMYTSSVLSHIGGEHAWDTQEEALDLYSHDFLEHTVILLERAHYLLDQDIDQAAETAADALLNLGAEHRLPLLVDQATAFGDELAEHSLAAANDYRSPSNETAA
ncbi:hypothetical protein [Nocardiopsis nanhaiensis]